MQSIDFNHSKGVVTPVDVVSLSEIRQRRVIHDSFAPTLVRFYYLQIVTEGQGYHWIDFDRYSVDRGDIFFVRENQIHALDRESSHEAKLLVFRAESLPFESLRFLGMNLRQPFSLSEGDFSHFAGLVEMIERVLTGDGYSVERNSTVYLLQSFVEGLKGVLPECVSEIGDSQSAEDLVFRFEDLLLQQKGKSQLGDYLDVLKISQKTLYRACIKVRGVSPKVILDKFLIFRAKRKLILEQETVESLAIDLGFSESTNFVKFFKRVTGETPDDFRQKYINS